MTPLGVRTYTVDNGPPELTATYDLNGKTRLQGTNIAEHWQSGDLIKVQGLLYLTFNRYAYTYATPERLRELARAAHFAVTQEYPTTHAGKSYKLLTHFDLTTGVVTPLIHLIERTEDDQPKERLPVKVGRIEGISGPMFCGKTEEMLRRLQRAKIAGKKVQFLTPSLDTRRGAGRVVSNGGRRIEDYGIEATPVHATNPIATSIHRGTEVVAIDEIQFYGTLLADRPDGEQKWGPHPLRYRIVEEVKLQAEVLGRDVLWAGLDMNFRGEPFGPVPYLLAISRVTKLTSVCRCGSDDATYTHRLVKSDAEILVGAENEYTVLCRECYFKETACAL